MSKCVGDVKNGKICDFITNGVQGSCYNEYNKKAAAPKPAAMKG